MTVRRTVRMAAAAGMALGVAGPAAAQVPAERSMAAFEGVWKFNPARSRMERAGPGAQQTVRANSFTWVFKRNGRFVDLNIYHSYPAPAPSKVMAVVTDNRFHPCRMSESCLSTPGDPKEQDFAFWQSSERIAGRVFRVRGTITEYNLYAVSADGQTFVAESWSPQTPQYRNFQIFEKQH